MNQLLIQESGARGLKASDCASATQYVIPETLTWVEKLQRVRPDVAGKHILICNRCL